MYVIPAVHPAFILRQNRRLAGTLEHAFNKACALGYKHGLPEWDENEFILPKGGSKTDKTFTLEVVLKAVRSMAGKCVAYDVETDGRHPLDCDLRCLALYDGDTGITIPFLYRDGGRKDVIEYDKRKGEDVIVDKAVWLHWWKPEEEAQIVAAVCALLGPGVGEKVVAKVGARVVGAKKASEKKIHGAARKPAKKYARATAVTTSTINTRKLP